MSAAAGSPRNAGGAVLVDRRAAAGAAGRARRHRDPDLRRRGARRTWPAPCSRKPSGSPASSRQVRSPARSPRRELRLVHRALPLPRPQRPRLDAGAAAGDADLRDRLCLYRPPAVQRPGAALDANRLALQRAPARRALAHRRRGAVLLRVLPLHLPHDAHGAGRTVEFGHRVGPTAGTVTLGSLPARRAAADHAIDRRRGDAGADGDARRRRRDPLLRPEHLLGRHLQDLVRHGQPERGADAGGGAACHGDRHLPDRAQGARPGDAGDVPHPPALGARATRSPSRCRPGCLAPACRS